MARVRLSDVPLAVKVGAAPVVALVAMAVLAALSVTSLQRSSAALNHVVSVEMPQIANMRDLSRRIVAAHGETYRLLTHVGATVEITKVDGQMKALSSEFDSITRDVTTARAHAVPQERPIFDRLLKQLSDTHAAVDLIGTVMDSDFITAAGFAAPFEDSYQQMSLTLKQLVADKKARVDADAHASDAASAQAVTLTIASSIIALLGSGLLATAMVLNTRQATRRIAKATEALAGGDNDQDLAALKRGDELGAIVESLQVFRDNQVHLAELRIEQERAEAAADALAAEKLAEDARVAEESRLVVRAVAEGLAMLAEGDLTFRITADFPRVAQKLKDDFNDTIEQLQGAVSVIVENASRMRAGAGEISHAADDLSRRTEQQAATLEETAAALDQITATVRKTADGATQARKTVAITKADAEKSGGVVQQAVGAMDEIERSASEIGQIISVIDEIAFQTNLLALNAGVEAARAGDAGRGFAVVASEVRALAQRSAQAAKEIKGLISASSRQVRSGVDLVGQTGEALVRIVTQIGEINALVLDMAASAEEQAGGLQQVNTAVNQMDQVTQQNAAMVEQSTAASHTLAAEAQTLTELVSRFRIGEASARPVLAAEPARGRANAPSAAARSPALNRGGALRRPAPVIEDEGWEEF